jgi:SNF2 family DNA or RNA helicase
MMNQEGTDFLNILNSKSVSDCEGLLNNLRVKATLRDYQKHGIAWILSLTKFGFNCSLCDEMGLGKTLQSLAALAIITQEEKEKQEKHPISLVVCPSTLVHNW